MRKLIALAAVLLAACSSGSPVSAPNLTTSNAIQTAHVLVDGVPVEGTVLTGSHQTTRLQAQLRDRDRDHLALVRQIRIDYELPGMGMGGARRGQLTCHDDGTHGDALAGDGICNFMDDGDQTGCARLGSPQGTYRYTFHCEALEGSSCGELMLSVTRR